MIPYLFKLQTNTTNNLPISFITKNTNTQYLIKSMNEQTHLSLIQILTAQDNFPKAVTRIVHLLKKDIQKELENIHDQVVSMYDFVQKQFIPRYQSSAANIQVNCLETMDKVQTYLAPVVMHIQGYSKNKIIQKLTKQRQFIKEKVEKLSKANPQPQKEGTTVSDISRELEGYSTTPLLFRFQENYTALDLQSGVQEIQRQVDQEISSSLSKIISKVESELQQFEDFYSYSLNDPSTDQTFKILKHEYQRGQKQLLQNPGLSVQEIINLKQLYLQIRATIQEQIQKGRQSQEGFLKGCNKKLDYDVQHSYY